MNTQAKNPQFGYPINIPRTYKNMLVRCRIIQEGINSGKWRGAKLELAKYHLNHYRCVARMLRKSQNTSKKRAA